MASLAHIRFKDHKQILSTKTWVLLGVLLFLCIFTFVSVKVYQAQPAQIVVRTSGLNPLEYKRLNTVMEEHSQGSFFTAPLPELQKSALAEDWISQVNIERKWGEGIVVSALPRKAIARFGSNQLIDATGKVFEPVNEADLYQDGLIMLQGEEEQSILIMQQMQQVNQWFAPLDIQVQDMVLTPRMTWVILFDDGLRVIVDNEQTSQKLMNLSQLLQNQLSNKRQEISSIDLRYKNGLVISWHNLESSAHSIDFVDRASVENASEDVGSVQNAHEYH